VISKNSFGELFETSLLSSFSTSTPSHVANGDVLVLMLAVVGGIKRIPILCLNVCHT
jgi:hypothetical protein